MQNLTIVTAYTPKDEWKTLGELTTITMAEYAERHNFKLLVRTEGFDESRAFTWSKILFIRNALIECDWVWWLDADAAITNQTKTLDDFLRHDVDVIIGEEVNKKLLLNAGSMLIRRCSFSFWLLDEIWKREDLAHKSWHEQSALADLYRAGKCSDRVRLIPFRELNGYTDWYAEQFGNKIVEETQWHVGDFVAHCAGYDTKHRISILKQAIELTIRL
jgi:hypothetical protein